MENDISEISDTRTRSNPRELTENILNFPNIPDAGGGEEINPTLPLTMERIKKMLLLFLID